MKKIVFLLSLVAFACAGGGRSKAQNEIAAEITWGEKDVCAVVFLGYGKNFSDFADTESFKTLCARFPSLKKATKFTVETEGDELYYLIPRYSNTSLEVHEYRFDLESMVEALGRELYKGGDEPILLHCNFSDIHPNTSVTVTGKTESVTFHPMSSFGVQEGVQFVHLEQEAALSMLGFSSEYGYKGVYAGILAKVNQSGVRLYFDREEAVYIMGDNDFIPEDSYVVELVEGACKGVFIGNVGQDFNPILCCLMEDGGIEILELYRALRDYDFSTSGRLHGHENIVSVSNEGVYGDEGEGGGYIVLFSHDAKGNKKEIELCPWLEKPWECLVETEDGVMCYLLEFTSDWKISYKSGFSNSEALEFFVGRFWLVEEQVIDGGVNSLFHYQMKEADRSEMTGEASDPRLRTGAFRIQVPEYWSDYIDLTHVNGLLFHPTGQGRTIRFEKRANILSDDAAGGSEADALIQQGEGVGISMQEAVETLAKLLNDPKLEYMPENDNEPTVVRGEKTYYVRAYHDMGTHIVTFGHFYIGRQSGTVYISDLVMGEIIPYKPQEETK